MSVSHYRVVTNRKELVEKTIVQKRDQDAERQKQAECAAQYHQHLNFISSQYKKLDEQQTGKTSRVNEESRVLEEAKVDRKEKLLQRREKLAKLLGKEGELHLVEMKTLENVTQDNDPWNITKLKEQIEDLRKRRDEEEEELRQKNMYHMFQEPNSSYIKEHNLKLSEEEVKKAMEMKKMELEEQALKRKSEEQRQLDDLELFREDTWHNLKVLRQEKKDEGDSYVKIAQEKMKIYEDNKLQVKNLDDEFQLINKYQNVIDGVKKKRQKVQEIQAEKKTRISQFRPSKEKVRKMCVEVRHGLELDLATLNYLNQLEIRQRDIVNVHVNMDKIGTGIESIQEKLSVENKHIEEIQPMFEEEAISCWDKWKNSWDQLTNEQDTLLKEVCVDLVNQLEQVVIRIDKRCQELEATNSDLYLTIKKDREEHNKKLQMFRDQEAHYSNMLRESDQRIQRIMNARKNSLLR